ncbi:hypothetical protein ACCT09_36890, partial [Rhizobium ruizarguesonis]
PGIACHNAPVAGNVPAAHVFFWHRLRAGGRNCSCSRGGGQNIAAYIVLLFTLSFKQAEGNEDYF